MPGPPVARTICTFGLFIKAVVAVRLGCSIHWIQFSGAPAATVASLISLAVSTQHFWACGWKPKMMVFLLFMAIIALKITVEVGLVTGVTPAMAPIGSAIFIKPSCLSSSITPTVFISFMLSQIVWAA